MCIPVTQRDERRRERAQRWLTGGWGGGGGGEGEANLNDKKWCLLYITIIAQGPRQVIIKEQAYDYTRHTLLVCLSKIRMYAFMKIPKCQTYGTYCLHKAEIS